MIKEDKGVDGGVADDKQQNPNASDPEVKKAEGTEVKTKVEELQSQLDSVLQELDKYKRKDYNFKQLRDMTEEEKAKLSASELELRERQERLEAEQKEFKNNINKNYVEDALSLFSDGDKDLSEKIMFHYDRLIDKGETKDQIIKKMKDAFTLATAQSHSGYSPVARAAGYQSPYIQSNKSKEPLSDGQKSLGSKLGIKEADLTMKNPFDLKS